MSEVKYNNSINNTNVTLNKLTTDQVNTVTLANNNNNNIGVGNGMSKSSDDIFATVDDLSRLADSSPTHLVHDNDGKLIGNSVEIMNNTKGEEGAHLLCNENNLVHDKNSNNDNDNDYNHDR